MPISSYLEKHWLLAALQHCSSQKCTSPRSRKHKSRCCSSFDDDSNVSHCFQKRSQSPVSLGRPFTGLPIAQEVAIKELQSIRLNESNDNDNNHNVCKDRSCKIKRRLFPGNATNGSVGIAFLEAGESHRKRRNNTIILIPGFPLTKECWVAVIRRLCKCFHVIAIDQRGFGSSGKPDPSNTSNYLLTQNAIDLHELILFLNLQNPVLWGHSYGTQVIFEYLKLFNSGSSAPFELILQNGYTQFANSGAYVFNNAPSQVGALANILTTQGYPALVNALVNLAINDQCQSKCCAKKLNKVKEFAFLMGSTATAAIAGAVLGGVLSSVSSDPTFLATIKQPTLEITGTLDAVINPRASFYIGLYLGIATNTSGQLDPTVVQPMPKVEVNEVRGSGHFIHMTHVNVLVKRVLGFLGQQFADCTLETKQHKEIEVLECQSEKCVD